MSFIDNNPALSEGIKNITIPVDQIPNIQTAIINAGVQGMIVFFFLGVGITAGFCYLYFLMWKKANSIGDD